MIIEVPSLRFLLAAIALARTPMKPFDARLLRLVPKEPSKAIKHEWKP